MKKILCAVLLALLCTGCGAAAQVQDVIDDATEYATFSIVNSGDVHLLDVRFRHLSSGTDVSLGHALHSPLAYLDDWQEPEPPLVGIMENVHVGWNHVTFFHDTGHSEFIQMRIFFGPGVYELVPLRFD